MPRINPVNPQQASDKSNQLLEGVQKKLGMVPNLLKTMAHSPAVLESYLGFSTALSGTALTPRQRELIAVAVAARNECGYCLAAHTAIGKGAGVSKDDLAAAQTGDVSDDETTAVISFARTVVEKQGHVSDTDIAAARDAGLNDAQVLEIVATVALNILTNYINHVADTEIDFPKVENRLVATA